MYLLNAIFLGILLPLLSLPFLVHIFNKKFPKKVNFPNIQLIKASLEQRSKLFRLRHIILMILRTLALLLLLICFLQPMMSKFGSYDDSKVARNIVIVLDNSLSMNYPGGSMASRQKALIEIEKLIDSLADDDAVNLIVAEKEIRACFDKPQKNHSEILAFARSLNKSLTSAELAGALAEAERQVNGVPRSEIYIISDFQRSAWGKVDLSFIKDSRLFYVDVSSSVNHNRAITGVKVLDSVILSGRIVPVDIQVTNFSDKVMNDRLEVRIGEKETLYFEVVIQPWNVGEFRVDIPLRKTGEYLIKASIAPDDLPEDDTFYFNLKALDKEEVVIVSDSDMDKTSANYLLDAALNPFLNISGSLLPKTVRADALAPMHLVTATKVFVTGIERLNAEAAALLVKFMNDGGSVVYFMDTEGEQQNLEVLQKALPVQLPFIAGKQLKAANIPGGSVKIRSGKFDSKILSLFRGEARKRLGFLDFYEYYQARISNSGQILLSFAEGTPAMGAASVGLGQILLCNFSVKESASNMATQKLFPAWVHEICKNLSKESRSTPSYETGETIQNEIWVTEMRDNQFVDEAGAKVPVKSEFVNDDRVMIAFTPTKPGHYKLARGTDIFYAFAVNTAAEESDLRPIDVAQLQTASDVKSFKVEGREEYEDLKSGQKIYHWFLLACLSFLFIELVLFQIFRRISV